MTKNTKNETLKKKLQKGFLAIIVLVLLVIWLIRQCGNFSLSMGTDTDIDITPEQIQSIRDIGQWEFLAVSDEELIDTVRRGFFSDDHLARIYYGTLRLGVDLTNTKDGWITVENDSLSVIMPKVRLLDEQFIDEARTQSFHETGRWSAKDREAMYQKAQRLMKSHCLTQRNFFTAQKNGELQMRQLLKAMGFEKVSIRFED